MRPSSLAKTNIPKPQIITFRFCMLQSASEANKARVKRSYWADWHFNLVLEHIIPSKDCSRGKVTRTPNYGKRFRRSATPYCDIDSILDNFTMS